MPSNDSQVSAPYGRKIESWEKDKLTPLSPKENMDALVG